MLNLMLDVLRVGGVIWNFLFFEGDWEYYWLMLSFLLLMWYSGISV